MAIIEVDKSAVGIRNDTNALPFKAKASRILASAQSPIDMTATLAVAPTVTESASQTLNTNLVSSGTHPSVTPLGGSFALISSPQYRIQGVTSVLTTARVNGHGAGVSFAFYGQTIELGADFRGAGWVLYATDLTTGIRYRAQANDYTDTNGYRYYKIDFGSVGFRGIEIYNNAAVNNAGTFGTLGWGTNSYIYDFRRSEPKIGILWDSWGQGILTSGTNQTKLAVPDYLCAQLGVANMWSYSVGGTGFVATNNSTAKTYLQRLQDGDFDRSRIGDLDAVFVSGTLNDYAVAGNTAAATEAAILPTMQALRVAQPNAIISLTGPEYTPVYNIPQSWFDAHQSAFDTWADPHSVYLDNSPSGENWSNSVMQSIMFTGSQNHVNDVGKVIYGVTAGQSFLSALRDKYSA